MFAPVWWTDFASRSGSRSGSGSWSWSGSWSRSGSGSRSSSPPSLYAYLSRSGGIVGELARAAVAGDTGAAWVLWDAIQEEPGVYFMLQFEVGKAYYVETFGKYYVGRVKEVTPTEVILSDAAWVADTGRLSDFLRDGRAEHVEVEPIGEWHIPLMYVSGKQPWKHKCFKERIG